MVKIYSNGGRIQYGVKEFMLDDEEDLKDLPHEGVEEGSVAFVISTSDIYMITSTGIWVKI